VTRLNNYQEFWTAFSHTCLVYSEFLKTNTDSMYEFLSMP
jgi:hypothetical protein